MFDFSSEIWDVWRDDVNGRFILILKEYRFWIFAMHDHSDLIVSKRSVSPNAFMLDYPRGEFWMENLPTFYKFFIKYGPNSLHNIYFISLWVNMRDAWKLFVCLSAIIGKKWWTGCVQKHIWLSNNQGSWANRSSHRASRNLYISKWRRVGDNHRHAVFHVIMNAKDIQADLWI